VKDGKPTHYKVICISLYTEDLAQLDAKVRELKARGFTKANRSSLIRYAMGLVDASAIPRAEREPRELPASPEAP
jgi:hypothetical protein